MADPTQTAVPSPPDADAITQRVKVFDPQDNLATVPIQNYMDLVKSEPGWTLAIPARSPDGKNAMVRGDKFKPLQDQGWRVRREDTAQIPLVYELSKQLQDRDPGALERFVTPFWDAVVSSVPDWARERRQPTPTEKLELGANAATGGFSGLAVGGVKQVLNIPKAWLKAAKLPTPGETSAAAISSLPIPFAPQIALGTQDATTGNIAGAFGNAGLAGGMYLIQKIGPKISELDNAIGEQTPDAFTKTKQLRNLGAQREIVAKTNEISPQLNPQDLASIWKSAGAEVKTAEQLNEEGKQFEERVKQHAAVDKANLADVSRRGATAAEQTRRVIDLSEVERLSTEVTDTISRPPIQQAEHVIEVVGKVQGATDEIERAIYPYVYRQAEAAGVETDIAPVGRLIARETRSSMPAQTQLGTAGVSARTLKPAAKMQAGASGTPDQIRAALELGDVGQLSPNQLDAINSLMQAMESSTNRIPFAVADEAQRGLGASIRYLHKAKASNPNVAPDLRLLQTIQTQLKQQIAESLAQHPEIHELYDTAHEVTREQHDIIDQNIIKKMFADPRNRLAGETLVNALLKTGTEKLQGAILQALDVGPSSQRALDTIRGINPEQAARISQKVSGLAAASDSAKRGLRRMVVDAAIRNGTQASTTEGVKAPNLNYNAMIQFLEDRPGAKILVGDQYDPLLRDLRAKADAKLRQTDPDYENFIQRETARYEIKRTPVNAPAGADEAMQELSEAEFVKKLTNDATFRRAAVRNATPAIRQRMVRSVIENGTQDAMIRGVPGTADAVMDFGKWGKNLADRAQVIEEIGGVPAAARELQGLGRAAERADQAASTGLVGHVYGFFTGLFGKGVRASASIRPGVYSVGPKQIAAQIHPIEPPVELPSVPRNLDEDIFRASQDPELARMMKRALKVQPWEPGAGTEALKYYLAFAGGKTGSGKALDEKKAQELLDASGGKIDDAVAAAQAQGYTR